MTIESMDVRRAERDESRTVGRVLAAAFADDPVFQWLIPPGVAGRDERMLAFFTSIARSYLRRDKHVFLGRGGAGAAMWSAPGSWTLPVSEMVREGRPAMQAFGRRLPRAVRTQLEVESGHPKDPKHWYLGYLGVDPGHQGQGIGAALLAEVLDQADVAGVPAYLESSNERNLSLYKRHGFEVTKAYQALGHGPTIWRMWRDPR